MKVQKILIVEDDMIIQMFIANIVKKAGFEIVGEARSCDQAVKLAELKAPDLILMDIGIIGPKDGIETAEIIKNKFEIPVIFMTGNSDEYTINRALKIKPLDIFYKPIDEVKLEDKLHELNEEN